MRAVTENRDLAAVSGLANRRVDRLTFFIGSGLAGIAGVAISLIGAIGFQIGHQLHHRRLPRRRSSAGSASSAAP